MGKLIIACMDGASASARRTHTRMYMSDIVEAAAKQYLRFKKNDLVICRENDYLMKSRRGGAIFSRKSVIRRFILKHNSHENNLLCVGKSYGGWNMNNILTDLKPILNYDKVHLILVDACWIGKMFNQSLEVTPPRVDRVCVYYQNNMRRMNGARSSRRVDVNMDLSQDRTVDHWNIVENLHVIKGVRLSIQKLGGPPDF